MNKILHKLRLMNEHRMQVLGFYTSVAFALIAILLWYVETHFLMDFQVTNTENIAHIQSINVTFTSIMIGILLTTFSVVFVVMQLASSQFSPRILRHFMYSDYKIQYFIGWFLGGIVFVFIPQLLNLVFSIQHELQLCTLVSLCLNLFGVVYYFPTIIAHLSDNMNVATIANHIKKEVLFEIDVLYPDQWKFQDRLFYKRAVLNDQLFHLPIYWKTESGYLTEVKYAVLQEFHVAFFEKNPSISMVQVLQKPIVGEYIMSETTEVLMLSFSKQLTENEIVVVSSYFNQLVKKSFKVNKYRSNVQDINFGVRKLVDIAIKAISPAVNDPTTCVNCIDCLGEIVRRLSVKKFPSQQAQLMKSNHIVVNEFNYDELIDFCFDQIIQWGKNDHVVIKRIIKTLQLVIPFVENPHHLMVLIRQVEEMELDRIYNITNEHRIHSMEQIKSVQKELVRFHHKAMDRILKLEQTGILDYYENLVPSYEGEKNSVQYLKAYKVNHKG